MYTHCMQLLYYQISIVLNWYVIVCIIFDSLMYYYYIHIIINMSNMTY